MIVNGESLFIAAPIVNMEFTKVNREGVSYGLGEAGYDIRIKQDVIFQKNTSKFVLASAMEEFRMPDNLVGIVHDKSTWARRGLSVFNTVIEPGWYGFLTLELVYHGNETLIIPAGAGIAQVIFHTTTCKANYAGKYQHQSPDPVPAKFE